MPITIPTYISKTAPRVVDRGGTSPENTGLPVARGLQSVTSVMAGLEIEAERQVGNAARLGEFVARKGQLSDRLGALEDSLAQDPDHRTYFDRAKKGIEESTTEALSGINDPALKDALLEHTSSVRDRFLLDARHKARALTVDFTRGELEKDIDRNIKSATSAADSEGLTKAEGEIEAAIRGAVKSGILSAAHGEEVRRGVRDKINNALDLQLSDQEPDRFLSNYREGLYKDRDPLKLEEHRRHAEARLKSLDTRENLQAAGEVAEEIWGRMGPVSDLTPVNLDVMEGEISRLFAGSQERAKLARAVLREKTAAHDKGVAERRAANLGAVWGIHARGGSIVQVLASPEYDRLPGTDQAHVKDTLLALSRQLTREEKASRQEGWDARYYEISTDPDALAGMSADQFKALYPEVGPANWRRLDQEKRRLSSPETLSEAKIDTDLFKTLAGKAGYDISPRTENGKQRLANLKTSLLDGLIAVQKDKGRKLSPDEKAKVLKTLATQVTVKGEETFFWFPVTQKKPVVSVKVKGNIQVPEAKRQQIVADFKKLHGRAPSENQVIDAWIAMAEEE